MSALADVELFGQDFVVEARVLLKELLEGAEAGQRVAPAPTRRRTHKLYSVARLDVLELGDLHFGQVMERLLVLLPQQS